MYALIHKLLKAIATEK